jgi:hypothetical protein
MEEHIAQVKSAAIINGTIKQTDEHIEIYLDIINNSHKIQVYDGQINKIIMEEAGAYFAGQKSAEEVADVIENRVGIYIKELK